MKISGNISLIVIFSQPQLCPCGLAVSQWVLQGTPLACQLYRQGVPMGACTILEEVKYQLHNYCQFWSQEEDWFRTWPSFDGGQLDFK